MDSYFYKTERAVIKIVFGAVLAIALLIGLCAGGYYYYQRWESRHLIRRAEAYLSGGDAKAALLTATRAFQVNSSNVEACRLLARIAEEQRSPAAIQWRQQVMTITPQSTEDGIALARSALQFGNLGLAESALAKLKPDAARLATTYEIKAQVALAKKNPASAEENFAEAVKLDPSNKSYQFNLACLQLQSTSPEVRSQGMTTLEKQLEDGAFRLSAAHALRDHAIRQKDVNAILRLSKMLHDYPEASFRDRIAYVQILHRIQSPEFVSNLSELQTEAIADPSKITELLSWMVIDHLSLLAIDWVKRLPSEVVTKRPVPAAVADCYASVGDWAGLELWCKTGNWEDLEFLRHAYLSRAARERGDEVGFSTEWNIVLREAGSDGDKLHALEREVVKWGWKKEAEDFLWALSKDSQKQEFALAALYEHYAELGDTENLYRVVAKRCELKPDDDKAQSNFAQLSLLLNLNVKHADEVAERLYRKDPQNSLFASTHALSLSLKGKDTQAAKVMSGLKPEDLENQGTAAYYGIFLAAAGEREKAAIFLQKGSGAPMLPQEKLLFERAQRKVTGTAPKLD